ncbi:allergen Tha p 1 [Galleria mellonella]|uniref:Allergen Tha p 1 n=1 Tax=Galleria mellonella TaxID=7137 RepID=A0A5C0E225_GALME|nr:allergen Tha p 1 [Galleria mellonella]XP_052755687.1 allergen Tha p 1 [Galleria mellonella]XP_052755688.1 allergen Tha p 1 [Galleria mellonella]QEI46816.1 chemosensory protein 18 [Galleria mellonella]
MNLILFTVVATIGYATAQSEQYTDRYDSLRIDDVLANKRLTAAYIKCMLEKGKCTAEGRELKSHITEALQNGCSKCTQKQLAGVKKVIKHLINKENAYWVELTDMYDPKKEYRHKYERELKSL